MNLPKVNQWQLILELITLLRYYYLHKPNLKKIGSALIIDACGVLLIQLVINPTIMTLHSFKRPDSLC
jgi:hypothetical protein